MTEKEKDVTPEKAREILQAEERQNLQEFDIKIKAACQEHGYRIIGMPDFVRRPDGSWQIVTKVAYEKVQQGAV